MTIKNPRNQRTGIYARQGDIGLLFYPHDELDPNYHEEIMPTVGFFELGIGEATAQRHRVAAADCQMFRQNGLPRENLDMVLVVNKDTPMLHPEHENKIITAGIYIVRRQREGAGYVVD